jgi:ketosteroid isomerase-like protein
MASAQEIEALIRRGYELFNSGNMEELATIFAEDVVWHAGGRRFGGEKRGRDAVFAYFGELVQATNGTFRAELHDVAASSEHGVGIHTNTAQRNGRTLNLHEVLVFHVRDSKVIEAWEHYEDTQTWDEFFA